MFFIVQEPALFKEASQDPLWVAAMQHEIDALEGNYIWDLVTLSAGHKIIGAKWVYKINYTTNSEIYKYKSRLVAKGYTQREGLDFYETFFPLAKIVTVKTMVYATASRN